MEKEMKGDLPSPYKMTSNLFDLAGSSFKNFQCLLFTFLNNDRVAKPVFPVNCFEKFFNKFVRFLSGFAVTIDYDIRTLGRKERSVSGRGHQGFPLNPGLWGR